MMALASFRLEYAGFSATEERAELWSKMLAGIDDCYILAAVTDILTTRDGFPPTVATVRRRALELSRGELVPPSGVEAWEGVRAVLAGTANGIEPRTLRAVRATAGSLADLRRSTSPAADRARFIEAFDAAVERERRERDAMPSVRAVAASARGDDALIALAAPDEEPRPESRTAEEQAEIDAARATALAAMAGLVAASTDAMGGE